MQYSRQLWHNPVYMEENENDFKDWVICGTAFVTENLIESLNPGCKSWILEEVKFLKPILR